MSKKEIIKQLAIKYKVSEKEIEDAVNHQFKFVSKQASTDKLPAIRLPFYGIFKPSKQKLKYIRQHNERNKNKRKDS